VDIISNCRNGILVDPLDGGAIAAALLRLLTDREAWREASRNGLEGVRRHYTWQAHASAYLARLRELIGRPRKTPAGWPEVQSLGYRDRAIFTGMDQTLLGDAEALRRFVDTITAHRKRVTFGIATRRRIDSALAELKKHGVPTPDVLISSLGTRVHYGAALTEDIHWADHIDHDWHHERIRRALDGLPGLEVQEKAQLSRFKISYFYDPHEAPAVREITALLHRQELNANVTLSFGQFLDVVPARASKGQALRYVALRLDIPLEQVLVAGGSGADEDMIRGNTLALVVANRRGEELSGLVDRDRVYFSDKAHAAGLLDAIGHYHFLGEYSGG
jgi:sucrose-phosphate synthase